MFRPATVLAWDFHYIGFELFIFFYKMLGLGEYLQDKAEKQMHPASITPGSGQCRLVGSRT